MLSPTQVIPFLEHPTRAVRELAVDYLRRAHDPTPATADDLWRALDRYGLTREPHLLSALDELPQTERSLARLLVALKEGPGEGVRFHLLHAVAKLDFELLRAHRDELLREEAIPSHLREHLAARLSLENVPPEALWAQLMAHAASVAERSYGEFREETAARLIEALARHPAWSAARAMALLEDPAVEDWR